MPVFRESVGSERQIVTRSQLVSVSWFEWSVGSTILSEVPRGHSMRPEVSANSHSACAGSLTQCDSTVARATVADPVL